VRFEVRVGLNVKAAIVQDVTLCSVAEGNTILSEAPLLGGASQWTGRNRNMLWYLQLALTQS
jgi:hypothetical protein